MSFPTVSGGCFFDNGITVADFHSLGSTPSLSELLKIAVTGAAVRCEKSFNTQGVSVTLTMNSAGNGSSTLKIG